MTYTQEQLAIADEHIPRVNLKEFYNDTTSKVMIDVRQLEELEASGTIKDALHMPKGVIEFRANSSEDIDFDTSIYVFCAVGVRSALAGYNLKKIGYQNVYNLVGFQDILDQGAEILLINN